MDNCQLTSNSRYNAKLAARPLLTQSVTTAVLFATGDITAQQLVEKKGIKAHDLTRTGRMALYGGCEYFPDVPGYSSYAELDTD